jgi:hypothetical protein
MPAKKSNKRSIKSKPATDPLSITLNSPQAESLAAVPWFNQRYLLPGEQVSDYDQQLQLLVDSVEVKDALDLVLVKDIHDELREVQKMRALRQSILLRGMSKKLDILLKDPHTYKSDPRVKNVLYDWEANSEDGQAQLVSLLDEAQATINTLMAGAYTIEAKTLDKLEQQLARHEKNLRETLKMMDARRNHAVMRNRLEFDLEQEKLQLINDNSDGNG